MNLLRIALVCSLLIGLVAAQRGRSRPSVSSSVSPPDDACDAECSTVADVVFILDDSNSIADWQFDIMKDFVADVINNDLTVSASEGHVGIVQFDDDSRVVCDLEDSLDAVNRCLDSTTYTDGGKTNIEAGIVDAMNLRNQRDGVAKVMVLMTDGDPTAGGDPIEAAEEAKAQGWEIFTIGIGNVSEDMLREIASDAADDHVFLVEEFEDLPDIAFGICVPGDCPEPPACGECDPIVDVVFILDESNSIADFQFEQTKEFVALAVAELGVGDDAANIGIVSFDDDAVVQCDIVGSEAEVQACLDGTTFEDGGKTNIEDAIRKAKDIDGGRSGVAKIMVLMTDGDPTAGEDPIMVAEEAKAEGWEIFAIGIGNVDPVMLEAVSSGADHVFTAEDFDDLLENVSAEFSLCVQDEDCDVCEAGEDVCESIIDVCFILDESNSIADFQFDLSKDFVVEVANQLGVGDDAANIGIVKFDDDAEVECDLEDSMAAVESCIAGTTFTDGGKTNIQAAIDACRGIDNRRSGVPDVMVLMTDGDPTAGGDPLESAEMAKNEGWNIFTIGIGNVDPILLTSIASAPDQFYFAEDFDQLMDEVLGEFQICLPGENDCEEEAVDALCGESDIVWVTDHSSSIATWEFDLLKEFQVAFVESTQVGPDGTQFGAVGFADDAWTNFDLNECSDSACVVSEINDIDFVAGSTNMAAGLREARMIEGTRSGVTKVFFFSTDGVANIDEDQVAPEAAAAQSEGWTLICLGIANADEAFLRSICDEVYIVVDFEALQGLVADIACS